MAINIYEGALHLQNKSIGVQKTRIITLFKYQFTEVLESASAFIYIKITYFKHLSEIPHSELRTLHTLV